MANMNKDFQLEFNQLTDEDNGNHGPHVGAEIKIASATEAKKNRGLTIENYFTQENIHPFAEVEWELRTAVIKNEKGEVIYEQKDVEFPKAWSQLATNVVVSKYFHTKPPVSEHSVKHMIKRVTQTITEWGQNDGYFATAADAERFNLELTHLMLYQKASFNSPVWFNVGVEKKPQCSACFINSVEDSMTSILDLAKTEGMLFKYGSGTGTNFSTLRSSREKLSTGGVASGPVSFMRGYDAFAGVIKSGGKTRRAAKMVILNVDHPDILEFIHCKAAEEKKAWALIESGYDGSFTGEAYSSVFFQNSNNSVRVTDTFMTAVKNNEKWLTRAVTTNAPIDTFNAVDLLRSMAEAAWVCGDPGMQFDTIINDWHTCPNSGRINASNPCSEYMFLDDTACNLASLNLMKFRQEDGSFDIRAFKHAVHIMILAQEIIVDNASYPTTRIKENSHLYRTLGLGFANLGSLLMVNGLPYDGDAGRALAAAITALMTGQAYQTSALIASILKPFAEFELNREPMLQVIAKHRSLVDRVEVTPLNADIVAEARKVWDSSLALGQEYGFRNAQVTVIAPTGTIGFMMDCDTTGIEPDIALVKYKKLVDGGIMKIINTTVPEALRILGYASEQIADIVQHIETNDCIENAPHLKPEHLPVFDCAFKPLNGERFIHHMGHLRMMAAIQPFISGAISKTVNMPSQSTAEEIMDAYIKAWEMGLKAIAIYRDGSKRLQPLSTSIKIQKEPGKAYRRRLPDERQAITHKFSISGHEGYLTVGMYEDGSPGEIFVVMAKEGSTISGLMDSFATAISLALQYGVPLEVLVNKFTHTRFEPSGFTTHKDIPMAKSIMDYIFRWLALKFLVDKATPMPAADFEKSPEVFWTEPEKKQARLNESLVFQTQSDSPPCPECGGIMVRSGSCYKCMECGSTSGCS